jgi:acyl-CoA dehydrogenase
VTTALLARLLDPAFWPAATLRTWWEATAAERGRWPTTIERALVGGACADRLGYAFASGYSEALTALVPDLAGEITALCATEEGGNQPSAIKTTLVAAGAGKLTLTGKKKWATVASEASSLLVVASAGSAGGRNHLRVVRVPVSAPGVKLTATAAQFVPEIPHAEVELSGVVVGADDVLPGDGYDDYLKPFRTVEDLHVHGALIGYLIGVARRHRFNRETLEQLAVLAASSYTLALSDPKRAATHVVLAGLISETTRAVASVEGQWEAAPDDEWTRWQRDRVLLQVASKARAGRRERAWEAFSGS